MMRKKNHTNTSKRIEFTQEALDAIGAARQLIAKQAGKLPSSSQVVNALVLYGLAKAREEGQHGGIILTGRDANNGD